MMNITEARELYAKLNNPTEDKVLYYLDIIDTGIHNAICDSYYYLEFTFREDDTERTVTDVCKALNDLGYSYASNLEFSPIKLTIYGWHDDKPN